MLFFTFPCWIRWSLSNDDWSFNSFILLIPLFIDGPSTIPLDPHTLMIVRAVLFIFRFMISYRTQTWAFYIAESDTQNRVRLDKWKIETGRHFATSNQYTCLDWPQEPPLIGCEP